MSSFRYKAKDLGGNWQKGLIEAPNEKEAVNVLREKGLIIVSLSSFRRKSPSSFLKFRRATFSDVVAFTRQLSTMITAGLVLTEALTILEGQVENPAVQTVIRQLKEEIEGGSNFASALEKFPRLFPKTYVALIRAGEASGMLDQILNRLADNLEKQRDFKSKTRGALIYPIIILIGMTIVIFIMMVFVIPRLVGLYKDFGIKLPPTTQLLISVSLFFSRFWWAVVGAGGGAWFLFSSWKKTAFGRRRLDEFNLKLPLLGKLSRQIILAEMTRTLGLLVGAGVPILEGLNIVSESVGNSVFKLGIANVARKVEKGLPLGLALSQDPHFPPLLFQMIRVGEETGKLDEGLLKLSHYFETESENNLKGLTTALGPFIMIILGVGVGFLVLSILTPIYSLTSQF